VSPPNVGCIGKIKVDTIKNKSFYSAYFLLY
jgi:hypothetical protein